MADIETSVLELMRCPITHSKLTIMSVAQLADLNETLQKGLGRDVAGKSVASTTIDTGLINKEESHAYLIRGGIIKLIADEAIVLCEPKSTQG